MKKLSWGITRLMLIVGGAFFGTVMSANGAKPSKATVVATATSQTDPEKFDLICEMRELDDPTKTSETHLSVDLRSNSYCGASECGTKDHSIQSVSPDEIVFQDAREEEPNGGHMTSSKVVNRISGVISDKVTISLGPDSPMPDITVGHIGHCIKADYNSAQSISRQF